MLTRDEWARCDALDLAALVARGAVSPREMAETAIARIEALNPVVNAVTHKVYDQALAELEAVPADAPFRGVPYLLKDLHAPARGMPLTSGSRLFAGDVGSVDSTLVARLRRAGFVLLGRSNSPEFGLNVSTEPGAFGATRNPWDLGRSAGGSSGGAAAAVAAGMLPAAHATDSGGSIRIPAACCGLVGLKPTRGLNPAGPHRAEANNGISHENLVSRTVRDTAAILDVTSGPDTGAPYMATKPAQGYLAALDQPQRPLRIAMLATGWDGTAIDAACAEGVAITARLLAAMGHHVDAARPSFDAVALRNAMFTMLFANMGVATAAYERLRGRQVAPDEIEPLSHAALARGRATDLDAYIAAQGVINAEVRRLAAFFDEWDVLVTSTIAVPPPPLGALSTDTSDIDTYLDRLFAIAPFNVPFNGTGQPAISLPVHHTADGLPIGTQLVGRFGEDATLLRLAARLEEATGWAGRRARM